MKSLPQSKSQLPVARNLRHAYREELRRILRQTSHHPGRSRIHAIRKDITKLRSWLRLAREMIGPHRFRAHNRRLRKAARALAPIRDAHVLRATFAAINSASSFPKTDKYFHKQNRCAKKLMAAAMRTAARCLKKELAARLPLKNIGTDFTAALERMREEMQSASAAARATGSMASLHTWRKRTKNYLHALVFVEGGKKSSHRTIARIGHLLGEDHDLAMLEAELRDRRDKPESPALLALIAARRTKLRTKIFHN
jgi:CHAD domain-containing protein